MTKILIEHNIPAPESDLIAEIKLEETPTEIIEKPVFFWETGDETQLREGLKITKRQLLIKIISGLCDDHDILRYNALNNTII